VDAGCVVGPLDVAERHVFRSFHEAPPSRFA
jgi:hypothetical protein